jgi:hypothetical protein
MLCSIEYVKDSDGEHKYAVLNIKHIDYGFI